MTLPATRLVSIRCGVKPHPLYEGSSNGFTKLLIGCSSDSPIPVNLHICAESRAEASKSYRRAFGFVQQPGQVMFNPNSDILYFGPREGYMAAESQFHTCMSLCDPRELALVRRIAISDALFWIDDTYRSMTAASLTVEVVKQLAMHLPALEQAIFVPREQDEAADILATEERMTRQVQMAMRTVSQQFPHWRPPPWGIVSLQRLSIACG